MHGSGMFVLNPPWTLPEVLKPSCRIWSRRWGGMPARATRWMADSLTIAKKTQRCAPGMQPQTIPVQQTG